MAKKTKEQLQREQLIKCIKATINTSTVLAVLEDVYLTGEHLVVTDLETRVSIPFPSPGEACVPANRFIDALTILGEPAIQVSYPEQQVWNKDEGRYDTVISRNPMVEFTAGKKTIKIAGDDPGNYPEGPMEGQHPVSELFHIGTVTEEVMGYLMTALQFRSTDELRPAMTGVFLGRDVVATDAHRLYRRPLTDPFLQSMIIPAKTLRIANIFGGAWELFWGGKYIQEKDVPSYQRKDENYKIENGILYHKGHCSHQDEWEPELLSQHAALVNADGVVVFFHPIDARYPDYNVVIPQGKGEVQFVCFTHVMRRELANALKFANRITQQVVLTLNGKATVSSEDVDFGFAYQSDIDADYQGQIEIGFNAKFMDQICAQLPDDEPLTMQLWTPSKAIMINEYFLLMPLMLNQ